MSSLDFAAFFRDVHGVTPLPWQNRLAQHLLASNEWPDLIDLPTASGKTACLDIALFHLAWCADCGEPWLAARRIVFMVDRRIIVDAAFDRAEKIRKALAESCAPAVTAVAEALLKLDGDTALICQKLRGGMPRERGFALNPAQPMIISSTIDQIGSRLLFRGYSMSPYSWPLHAGLLGHDTLLLLDEAHLSYPFAQTIAAIRREQARAEQALPNIRPVKLVPLSATAQTTQGQPFQLDAQDISNDILAERRNAPKPAQLVDGSAKAAERIKTLLRETERIYTALESKTPAVAVIVNRVRAARELYEQLKKSKKMGDIQIELMIGRSRPLDRDKVAKRLLARAGSNRSSSNDERGLIVVATQSIEVGADLDFQGMVTECASIDALRQRFGRLDRLGRFRKAMAVIVGGGEPVDDPIYGSALSDTWQWLNNVSQAEGVSRIVDFSIAAMDATLPKEHAYLAAPLRDCLPLTPAYVQLLAQTSPTPMYDPDVSSLLHGVGTIEPDIQVIWRNALPMQKRGKDLLLDTGEAELVGHMLKLMPPTSLETLALPLSSVRTWLTGAKGSNELTDIEGTAALDDEKPAKEPTTQQVWRRQQDNWKAASVRQLRPGDVIVVSPSFGGCDEYGFAPNSTNSVDDLSEEARTKLERERVAFITEESIADLAPSSDADVSAVWAKLTSAYCDEQSTAADLFSALLDSLSLSSAELGWPEVPTAELLLRKNGTLYALALCSGRPGEDDLSDEGLSSSRTVPVSLDRHNKGVGQRARLLARAVGLPESYRTTLGRAGDTHDIGKADPRFQRLLRGSWGEGGDQLLAKGLRSSRTRKSEPSERHEAYSVAVLNSYPSLLDGIENSDLATYLVGSHHGRGRPWMPDRADEGTAFSIEFEGTKLAYDGTPQLGALEAGWPSLYWRLIQGHGPWGLAYLEAVLRLADHLQSRDEMKTGTP